MKHTHSVGLPLTSDRPRKSIHTPQRDSKPRSQQSSSNSTVGAWPWMERSGLNLQTKGRVLLATRTEAAAVNESQGAAQLSSSPSDKHKHEANSAWNRGFHFHACFYTRSSSAFLLYSLPLCKYRLLLSVLQSCCLFYLLCLSVLCSHAATSALPAWIFVIFYTGVFY